MEVVVTIAVIGGVLLLGAFILEPLLRSEDELEPLVRERPGTRNLSGPHDPQRDQPIRTDGGITCQNCGAVVDEEFDYCGECATPVS